MVWNRTLKALTSVLKPLCRSLLSEHATSASGPERWRRMVGGVGQRERERRRTHTHRAHTTTTAAVSSHYNSKHPHTTSMHYGLMDSRNGTKFKHLRAGPPETLHRLPSLLSLSLFKRWGTGVGR